MPGSVTRKEHDRFKAKKIFQDVLTTTNDTCMEYFRRAMKDSLVDKRLCTGLLFLLVLNPGCSQDFGAGHPRMPRSKPRTGDNKIIIIF